MTRFIVFASFISALPFLSITTHASDGWTDFVADLVDEQKIVYVSFEEGEDPGQGQDPGEVYLWDDSNPPPEIGENPFEPDGPIKPFKTITAAYAELDTGQAGWILLWKGESWDDEGWDSADANLPNLKSGPSSGDGWMLIGAYSDDESGSERPSVKRIRATQGVSSLHSLAIVGIKVLGENDNAISMIPPGSTRLHIEDVLVPTGEHFGIQIGDNEDVRIRRSVVHGRYHPSGQHASGMLIGNTHGLLIEECVFWHNGWHPDHDPQECADPNGDHWGCPTVFNQNVYINCNNSDATFIRNISADASNVGCHHRTNGLNENNLYLRNNIGVHAGRTGDGAECQGIVEDPLTVRWNVILDAAGVQNGVAGIWVQRIKGATIDENLIAHFASGSGGSGIQLNSTILDTWFTDNVVYLDGRQSLTLSCNRSRHGSSVCAEFCGVDDPESPCPNCEKTGDPPVCGTQAPNICCEEREEEFHERDVHFVRNHFQRTAGQRIVEHRIAEPNGQALTVDWGAHWFVDTVYWSPEDGDGPDTERFRTGTNVGDCCHHEFDDHSFTEWKNFLGTNQEIGGQMTDMSSSYPDPSRDIESYLLDNANPQDPNDPFNDFDPQTDDAITFFMLLAINQAQGNWDERLTAARVNCYMRGGFDIPEPCPADLDDDGSVGVNDLLILLGCWGPVGSGCEGADLNGDGDVGVADLLILLANWGPCQTCAPEQVSPEVQDCLDTYEPGTPELKDCLEHVRDNGTFFHHYEYE